MNKKRLIKITALFAERKSKQNKKYIKKAFNLFADDLLRKYDIKKLKKNDDDIIDDMDDSLNKSFSPNLRKNLIFIAKKNAEEQTFFFAKKWRRAVDINAIKNKTYKKVLSKITAGKVTHIKDTFRKQLHTQINILANAGDSTKTIAKKIAKLSKGKIGNKRSLLIAREETQISLSISNNDTAVASNLKSKEWVYTFGAKEPRENHKALNGVTIGIDELFNLGDEKALHPKDYNLSASESINCYCLCFYHRAAI